MAQLKNNSNNFIKKNISDKNYELLKKIFIEELENDGKIIVDTNHTYPCCNRINIENIQKEFNRKLRDVIDNNPRPCKDFSNIGCMKKTN